jgi:hypothetical protein
MIGIGMPSSQSRMPRMGVLRTSCVRGRNASARPALLLVLRLAPS